MIIHCIIIESTFLFNIVKTDKRQYLLLELELNFHDHHSYPVILVGKLKDTFALPVDELFGKLYIYGTFHGDGVHCQIQLQGQQYQRYTLSKLF